MFYYYEFFYQCFIIQKENERIEKVDIILLFFLLNNGFLLIKDSKFLSFTSFNSSLNSPSFSPNGFINNNKKNVSSVLIADDIIEDGDLDDFSTPDKIRRRRNKETFTPTTTIVIEDSEEEEEEEEEEVEEKGSKRNKGNNNLVECDYSSDKDFEELLEIAREMSVEENGKNGKNGKKKLKIIRNEKNTLELLKEEELDNSTLNSRKITKNNVINVNVKKRKE
jgi:hypothetical protein